MLKKPDELLIGQSEHNIAQGFLLVESLWYQKNLINKYGKDFLYLDPCCFVDPIWISISHAFIRMWKGKSNWCLKLILYVTTLAYQENFLLQIKNLLSFLPIHLNQCAGILPTRWGKLQKFTAMELTTDLTLPVFFHQ